MSYTNRSALLRLARRLLFTVFIGILLLYILFPIYWTFISTFKTDVTFFEVSYWPASFSLLAYRIVASDEDFRRGIYNSMIVSAAVVALTMVMGALAGYAIGRLRFRGRSLIRHTVLAMIVVPQIAFLGGLYVLITNPCSIVGLRCAGASLYNSLWALIFSYLILTLPLTIWFLAAYYRDLPAEIEEAARVDGASAFQSFYHVMLPLAAPGMATTGILAFITAWNEFLFAVSFSQDMASRTAPVQIGQFGFVGYGTVLTLAASMIVMGPVVILTLAFGPQITAGLAGLGGSPVREASPLMRRFERRGVPRLALEAPEWALLLVLLLGALLFVQFGWSVIAFPYSVDYGEGPLLAQTIRLASFQNIYRLDLAAPPYTVSNYPPLYMLVLVPFLRLFGPAFWYGRLLSWLSAVVAAALVGLILHALTRDRLATLAGGLALLTLPYVSYWSTLYRIDALALALSLGGLYAVVRWPDRRWSLLAAGLLLTAAVYTRQSYGLAAPLAAFVWLLQRRPRRRAFALAGLVGGLGLALLLLLNLATRGGFLFNIVTANVNAFQLESLKNYLIELWTLMPFAVVGMGLFVVLAGWWRIASWRLIAPYALGAALTGLTIGKIGSSVNYLLEFSAAMCLALGAALAWLRPWPIARQVAMILLAIQMILLVPGSRYHLFTEAKLGDREDLDRLMRTVEQTNGAILADEDMGMLVLSGRPLYIQPFEVTQLAHAGVWDQRPFLAAIDRQEFAAILIFRIPEFALERERWTPEMLAEIARRYQVVEKFGNTYVYRPK